MQRFRGRKRGLTIPKSVLSRTDQVIQ